MADFQDNQENRELLASYVLGDLTPEEVIEVHKLLASHPELEAELRDLQETLALLPLGLPETSPPPQLGTQILQSAQSLSSVKSSPPKKQRLWLGGVAAVTTVSAIALGLYSYNLRQRLILVQKELSDYKEEIALLTLPTEKVFSLKSTKPNSPAEGSLLLLPKSGIAILTIEKLTKLPQGQIYRLWAMDKGEKIYFGQFNPDNNGKVYMQMPLHQTTPNPSNVVITVESEKTMTPANGEMVMTGKT